VEINKEKILDKLQSRLIVSVQSEPPEPLADTSLLAAMAKAAVMGGAAGIRANLPQNVEAISRAVDVPVIAIYKKIYAGCPVFITPTRTEIDAILQTNAHILAMDATERIRPNGEKIPELVHYIREKSPVLLMADVSTFEEGLSAAEMGFDMIGTTLSGYTDYTKDRCRDDQPDFELLQRLSQALRNRIPVIAEGRIWRPEQALEALNFGAFSVVVGSAITRPWLITEKFVHKMNNFPGAEPKE